MAGGTSRCAQRKELTLIVGVVGMIRLVFEFAVPPRVGLLHAGVRWIVTIFSDVTAVASQALPALPAVSPAREGHHANSEPPWADLGRPSRSVPAARA